MSEKAVTQKNNKNIKHAKSHKNKIATQKNKNITHKN